MLLQYFVTENKTGACIPVEITPATQSDLLVTKSGWQSDWTSDFIRDSQLEKRVAKAASGEIIALVTATASFSIFTVFSHAKQNSGYNHHKNTCYNNCSPHIDTLLSIQKARPAFQKMQVISKWLIYVQNVFYKFLR